MGESGDVTMKLTPDNLQRFHEGMKSIREKHKMQLHYEETNHRKWKYRLTRDHTFSPPKLKKYFPEEFEHRYFKLKEGKLTLFAGYCWDGLTSWPDAERNLVAALVHDVLLQAQDLGLIKGKTNHMHKIFRDMLPNRKEAWALYLGIRMFYPLRQLRKKLFN